MPGHSHQDSHAHGHVHEDMFSVEEAYERVIAAFAPLEAVETPILDTLGQVLAQDIDSPLDLPPRAN